MLKVLRILPYTRYIIYISENVYLRSEFLGYNSGIRRLHWL